MANSPTDKSESFIKSGMTLITQVSSDRHLRKHLESEQLPHPESEHQPHPESEHQPHLESERPEGPGQGSNPESAHYGHEG